MFGRAEPAVDQSSHVRNLLRLPREAIQPDARSAFLLSAASRHANALELVQARHAGSERPDCYHRDERHRKDDDRAGQDSRRSSIAETFTSLVLNPYVSGEDLLRLDPAGLRRRSLAKKCGAAGWMASSASELMRTLEDFLGSLNAPRRVSALLIVDEAQKLPIAGRSNRCKQLTEPRRDGNACCTIVLVGQLGLTDSLRSPELRSARPSACRSATALRPLTARRNDAVHPHRMSVAAGRGDRYVRATGAPSCAPRGRRATRG